jgi:Putative sensor
MSTGRAPGRRATATRLRLGLDPVRLVFSASPWRAAWFLLTYLLVSGVLFSISLVAGALALVLAVTIAAVPLLIAAAWVVRGCASFERLRLRQVLREPVPAGYPPAGQAGQAGLWRRARALWSSSGTWRELCYLIGLWPLLLGLDAVVFAVWAELLAGMTFPAWYGRVRGMCMGDCSAQNAPGLMVGSYPHGPHGSGAHGIYVDSLRGSLVLAAIFLALFLLFNYVLVATARLHAWVARAVLRRPADPLAPARQVLAGPGPLGPLTTADR